jgi:hypothetical protein
MVLGRKVKLQPCFAGKLHFCPEQHSARRVGTLDLPEVDDIASFDTGRAGASVSACNASASTNLICGQ